MTEYVKHATAEAEEYEKQRRKQAAEAIAQHDREAAERTEAAHSETQEALQAAEATRLDTVDTAAVRAALTRKQIRDTLARQGLTASGTETARLAATHTAERRAGERAAERRDATAREQIAALMREEVAIESDRAAAELAEQTEAEEAVMSERDRLLKAAYKAEAKEEAARIAAETALKKQAQSKAEQVEETNRRTALKQLLNEGYITADMYAEAMSKGWSVDRVIKERRNHAAFNKIVTLAHNLFHGSGFESMMKYIAPYQLNDEEWNELCYQIGLPRDRIDKWMAGYNSWLHSSPAAEAITAIFAREEIEE